MEKHGHMQLTTETLKNEKIFRETESIEKPKFTILTSREETLAPNGVIAVDKLVFELFARDKLMFRL